METSHQSNYIHNSVLNNEQLISFLSSIQTALKQVDYHWNIVKFWKSDFKFYLLNYPSSEGEPYPELTFGLFVDLDKRQYRINSYINAL